MEQTPKRILILSASYGAGHNQVSRAVMERVRRRDPEADVEVVDFFQFVSEPINKLTQRLYVQSVRHLPAGYGLFYKQTGHISHDSVVQKQLNQLGKDRLLEYLGDHPADLILCTFPTPAGVLSELKQEKTVGTPVHVVITDYVVHSQWIHPYIERYYVADPSVSEGLESRGIRTDRITVTGIPIREEFSTRIDKSEARRTLDLAEDSPVVLVMAGAFSMLGGLPEIVKVLAKIDVPHQTVVIAGHDKRLEKKLKTITEESRYPARVLGFVEDIKGYMNASDLLISKTGGITVSEALACGLPMVAFNVIPGQEASNCKFLLKNGAARYARDAANLEWVLTRLLTNGAARDKMARAAEALARPYAADDIAAAILAAAAGSEPRLTLTDARG